jgi:hypothetical protein
VKINELTPLLYKKYQRQHRNMSRTLVSIIIGGIRDVV